MERLRPRPANQGDASHNRRISAPLFAACFAQGFRAHPTLRPAGECQRVHQVGALPTTPGPTSAARVTPTQELDGTHFGVDRPRPHALSALPRQVAASLRLDPNYADAYGSGAIPMPARANRTRPSLITRRRSASTRKTQIRELCDGLVVLGLFGVGPTPVVASNSIFISCRYRLPVRTVHRHW